MKICPVCGAPVRVTTEVTCYQDFEGNWVVDGNLNDYCNNSFATAVCTNTETCGNIEVYNDEEHTHHIATIQPLPQYGFVTVDQLREFYNTQLLFKPAEARDEEDDKSFTFWRRHFLEVTPWSGIVANTYEN